ncbi:MAG: cytochrome P450 [Actinomycetia bacterium]|nr:cytochrome P450 [Actinomycetes bacterium]
MTIELADITSHDTYVDGVPHDTFRYLRAEKPVSWWDEEDGRGFWSVVRHADVKVVSHDHETFSSAQGIRLEDMEPDELESRRTLMEMDPPDHTNLRRLVSRLFTRGKVGAYEDTIREIAVDIIDRAFAMGEFDFVTEVARELPMRMLGRLMGLPDADGDWLVRMGDQMIANSDPEFTDHVVDQTDTDEFRLLPFRSPAGLELFDYADGLMAERRARPGEDLVSKMLEPTKAGEPLPDHEFKNFFALMVAAGNDTTRYSIAHATKALIDNPGVLAQLQAQPEQFETATEEFLRWATTTMHFRRTVTRDTELGGSRLKAGDKLLMWYISANYDEEAFTNPYDLDIAREPNDHVTFGAGGPHFCLGAWLGRLEVRVALEEIVPRLVGIEQTGPVERLRSNFINGIKHLPVKVDLR